jgi:peptide chain release factor 2
MRSGGIFDYDAKRERLEEVERELENPDIWNDPERAQALGRERSMLDKTVNGIRDLKDGLGGAGELLELAEMEDDEETALAVVADVDRFEKGVDQLEFQRMFSGKMDSAPTPSSTSRPAPAAPRRRTGPRCCCACTCAGPSARLQDRADGSLGGDVAGIKSATFKVEGDTPSAGCAPRSACTGWCASRRSTPTTAATPRSPRCSSRPKSTTTSRSTSTRPTCAPTSTALRRRWPARQQDRVGGAHHPHPDQHVVACQNERSQHKNRDQAMKMLKAKLYELEMQKRNAEKDALEATKSDIGWGSQIRLRARPVADQGPAHRRRAPRHPAVLDGDLDEFVEASLKSGLEAGRETQRTQSWSMRKPEPRMPAFLFDPSASKGCDWQHPLDPIRRTAGVHDHPGPQTDENHLIAERRAKLRALRAQGIAFPNDFRATRSPATCRPTTPTWSWTGEALEATGRRVRVAGRMHGQAHHGQGQLRHRCRTERPHPVVPASTALGETYDAFKGWDIGDIVAAEGADAHQAPASCR